MKKYNVAILGATGAVGREMIKVLKEYEIPVGELKLLASKRSAGQKITFDGREITVEEAAEDSFKGMDFVLGAVKNPMSKKFAPFIKAAGAVYIDNSSAFRMDPEVPLVVPEINGDDALSNNGIIANPNCSTIITMMAVAGIARISPIRTMVAATYQAVSGAGKEGFDELEEQTRAIVNGGGIEPKIFPTQIAMNVIPFIGSLTDNLYTDEEMNDYIQQSLEDSIFKFDIDVNENDKIISLITCTRMYGPGNDIEFKVDARLVRNGELKTNYGVQKSDKYQEIDDIMKGGENNA